MPEASRWCPDCGAEYRAGVETCADCGVPLVDEPPPPPPPVDRDTVTYDFADATEGQRRIVELLLDGAGIPFTWDNDGDLVVPHVAAGTVEELLEELEAFPAGGPSAEEFRAEIAVELGALTLRRVGTVMQYVGGVGVLVFAFVTYTTWDSINDDGFGGQDWQQKLGFILGNYTYLLFSALVIGMGTLGRLYADWVVLRLPSAGAQRQTPAQSTTLRPEDQTA